MPSPKNRRIPRRVPILTKKSRKKSDRCRNSVYPTRGGGWSPKPMRIVLRLREQTDCFGSSECLAVTGAQHSHEQRHNAQEHAGGC